MTNLELTNSRATPQQNRSIRKREQILAAALSQFEGHGYEATTAKTIAVQAGVAVGTFYQHFTNKDQVLQTIAVQRLAVLEQEIDATSLSPQLPLRQRVSGLLDKAYDFHALHKGFHQVLEQRRAQEPALAKVLERSENLLLKHTQQLVNYYCRKESAQTAYCLYAMAEGLIHRHVFHPSRISRNQVIATGAELLSAWLEQQLTTNQ